MHKIVPFLILGVALLCSCKTEQAVKPQPSPEPVQTAAQPPVARQPEKFDPGNVSQELFELTKADVQKFIENLNRTIRTKNYGDWKTALSDEYFAEISSPAFLAQASQSAAMKSRQIVLKSAADYFNNVVVPSRANSRVDDIEFVTKTRVKAFTVTADGRRLRLYELERAGNTWKIIN
jgi:hypothetical protein